MRIARVRFDEKSPLRVVSLAVVMLVHLVGALLLSLPVAPWRSLRSVKSPPSEHGMIVRLLAVRKPSPVRHHSSATASARIGKTMRHHAPARGKPVMKTKTHTGRKEPKQSPSGRPLDLSLPDTGKAPATVGRTLGSPQSDLHLRLPGGGHVHGAPRIELADPRTQGIAGALHLVQGLFGIVSSHCVDVDTWRGMTREQRFEHHVTDEQIRRTAEYYGCQAGNP